ncbi:MAG TPA: hypothetical protein VFD31_09280, partial [Thermoleophilaceae bacterium]|nr:hypothetical protein [Thermoleophilaceae bacterium]
MIAATPPTAPARWSGRARPRPSCRSLVEAVVCLSNGPDGAILLWMEDDGRVTAARPRHETGFSISEMARG